MRRLSELVTIGLFLAVAVSPFSASAEDASGPVLVMLVRHAEPAAEPADDPALSPAGRQRAEALARALRDSNVTAILTSTARRTRETAQPVANALGVTATAISNGSIDADVEALAAAVRSRQGAALVVGHSNTVPRLIAKLRGPQMPDLCDGHDRLFLLSPAAGDKVHFVRSRYGAQESDPSPDCP